MKTLRKRTPPVTNQKRTSLSHSLVIKAPDEFV
jgi:hypothetical protein